MLLWASVSLCEWRIFLYEAGARSERVLLSVRRGAFLSGECSF